MRPLPGRVAISRSVSLVKDVEPPALSVNIQMSAARDRPQGLGARRRSEKRCAHPPGAKVQGADLLGIMRWLTNSRPAALSQARPLGATFQWNIGDLVAGGQVEDESRHSRRVQGRGL